MTSPVFTRRRALAYVGAGALTIGAFARLGTPTSRADDGDMTTVLTLSGLTYNIVDIMGDVLQGFANSPGHIRKAIIYPAAADAQSIPAGVALLDDAIRTTPGKLVVLGHSQGAQVAGQWLREFAGRPDAPPPDRLSFILIGNPERRLGGRTGRKGLDGNPIQPTPDNTQYQVTDITRRWDGWGNADDWPDLDAGNPDIERRLAQGRGADHIGYNVVSLGDPAMQVRAKVGNTTYLVAP